MQTDPQIKWTEYKAQQLSVTILMNLLFYKRGTRGKFLSFMVLAKVLGHVVGYQF
jgi:hypothetical protein